MTFIDKSKPDSLAAATKLHDWRDRYTYKQGAFSQYRGLKFNELCQKLNITGDYLFGKFGKEKKHDLRETLREEQNGLCCYCCQKLDRNRVESTKKEADEALHFEPIEHFLDKSTHPCKTFNYENLLLACRGNKQFKKYQFARNDTKEIIAKQFQITVADLERENPNFSSWSFNHLEEIKIKLPQHCDVAKEDKPIVINPADPLQRNCWARFTYNKDGEIQAVKGDTDAEKAIDILKLNITALKEGRKIAWNAAEKSYQGKNLNEFLENSDYDGYKKELQLLKDSASIAPFSPVYWYFYGSR